MKIPPTIGMTTTTSCDEPTRLMNVQLVGTVVSASEQAIRWDVFPLVGFKAHLHRWASQGLEQYLSSLGRDDERAGQPAHRHVQALVPASGNAVSLPQAWVELRYSWCCLC